jgi:hypothetical protein
MDNLEDFDDQLSCTSYNGMSFKEICIATISAGFVFCLGGGLAWSINYIIRQFFNF